MGINSEVIRGHELLAVERFRDDTKHMAIFDVLVKKSPYGGKGQRIRLFMNDASYQSLREAEAQGRVFILQHASVVEGHILPDKKPKGRRRRQSRQGG